MVVFDNRGMPSAPPSAPPDARPTPALRLAHKAWTLLQADSARSIALAEQVLQLPDADATARAWAQLVLGFNRLNLATPAQLDVAAVGIASLPVRLTLAPDAAEPYRGRAQPIRFEITTTGADRTGTRIEKSTFFVPR